MEKLKKEFEWASVLQIAQSSHLDMVMASLAHVVSRLGQEEAVVNKGSDEYMRVTYLKSLLSGCYFALRGADGILTGIIVDMLDSDSVGGK